MFRCSGRPKSRPGLLRLRRKTQRTPRALLLCLWRKTRYAPRARPCSWCVSRTRDRQRQKWRSCAEKAPETRRARTSTGRPVRLRKGPAAVACAGLCCSGLCVCVCVCARVCGFCRPNVKIALSPVSFAEEAFLAGADLGGGPGGRNARHGRRRGRRDDAALRLGA